MVPAFDTKAEVPTGGSMMVEGDGITIDAIQSSMTEGSYTPDYNEFYVSTVEVDPASAGLPWDGLTGTPVAMWYLGNFDMTAEPSFPFSTASDYGLAPGTRLQIWSTSSEDKEWVSGGSATVTDDGKIVSDAGSGIRKLTTLVLTSE
jgi:hypothetical protein